MAVRPERLGQAMQVAPPSVTSRPTQQKGTTRKAQPRRAMCAEYKPTRCPDGFTLIVDTREQQPLFVDSHQGADGNPFNAPRHAGLVVVREALHDGDYSVRGYETAIVFERKKLSDFLSYVGRERKVKTEPKLARLAKARFAALVIEEDERKLAGPFRYSRLTREHVRGFLLSCRVRHGIHVYISKDRAMLEQFVLDHAVRAWGILQAERASVGQPVG